MDNPTDKFGSAQTDEIREGKQRAGPRGAPIAISVHEFCRLTSLSRTTAYKLMANDEIQSIRRLGRRLILLSSVQSFLQADDEGADR